MTVNADKLKIRAAIGLPVVLLIGGLVTEIAIAGVFMAYFMNQSGLGTKLSAEALAASRAGVQDAMIKIIRNKNLNYTTSGSPYTLTVGNRSAQVTICKDSKTVSTTCGMAMTGKDEITSLGIAFNKRRNLQVILIVHSSIGKVEIESEKEIAVQ